jgi:prolyl oligopeptidase
MSPPSSTTALTAAAVDDPYLWLEDVLDNKCLDWVNRVNAACLSLVGDPKKSEIYTRIKSILDSKDKIPHAYRINDTYYYNFWQDENHVQGLWRKTTLESFKTNNPDWRPVLDVDALPPPTTDTAKTWVWHGSTLLDEGPTNPICDRALIRLSPGGSDAEICREFDLTTELFVDPNGDDQGYELLTPAKTRISYRSRNEILVGTDFNHDGSTLTDSGYPRVVKSWKRGTPISEAVTVFEGQQNDIAANMYSYHDRGFVHEFQSRSITFYTSEYFYRSLTCEEVTGVTADMEQRPFRKVPIPEDAELGTFANMALITLRSDLNNTPGQERTFKAGSLVTLPMSELMEDDWTNAFAMFEPTPSRSLSSSKETRDYVILKSLEDVRTKLEFWKYDEGTRAWSKQICSDDDAVVAVGEDVSVVSHCRKSDADNTLWLWRDGYLVPDTLEMASAEDSCKYTELIKAKPAMFKADGLIVEQHFAKSKDGTRIPYFVMRRKDLKMNGSNAVLLDAYGGFEISMLPGYSAGVGAGWLERGGCKVIANIRGGVSLSWLK